MPGYATLNGGRTSRLSTRRRYDSSSVIQNSVSATVTLGMLPPNSTSQLVFPSASS